MQDLNDLYYFVQVVNHGSYAAAGRALGVPKSKLSRRIIELEDRLGIRLLQRSTRKLTVTEIGQEYHRHCVAMLIEAEAAQEVIDRSRSSPQGLIRLSAPPALICFEMGAMIARYMAANPLVTVELDSTARRVDVIGEGIDIAIRVRFPPVEDSELVLRVLGESRQKIVASPALLEKLPAIVQPADLSTLPSLDLDRVNHEHVWSLSDPDQAQVHIRHNPRLVTDDMSQLLSAAIQGVGAVQLPDMVTRQELQSGAIVELLPQWQPVPATIQAIFPSRRGLLPSVRSLIDFLIAQYTAAAQLETRAAHTGPSPFDPSAGSASS